MRWFLAVLVLLVCAGCPSGVAGERLKEINSEWYRIYTTDRRQTELEAVAYNALDDAGKEAWKASGKPVPGALPQRMLAAAEDYKDSIEAEAEANE